MVIQVSFRRQKDQRVLIDIAVKVVRSQFVTMVFGAFSGPPPNSDEWEDRLRQKIADALASKPVTVSTSAQLLYPPSEKEKPLAARKVPKDAIGAILLGLFGLFLPFLAPYGLYLARNGLRRCKETGDHSHNIRYQMGLYLNLIGCVLLAFLIIAIMVSSINNPQETNQSNTSEPIESILTALPADGVYSAKIGAGDSYQDPLHAFFSVILPAGWHADIRRDKTQFHFVTGDHAGEVVRCSWIDFRGPGIKITATARQSFSSLEEDIKLVKEGLQKQLGAIIYRSRFVTIDGVKGAEVIYSISKAKMDCLSIKYKKHGLDHAIMISWPAGSFTRHQQNVLCFLRSYKSIAQ